MRHHLRRGAAWASPSSRPGAARRDDRHRCGDAPPHHARHLQDGFGIDLADGHDDITAAFNYAFGYIAAAIAHPFRPPLFVPTPANRRYHQSLATIESFVAGLIEHAAKHPDASSMNGQIFKALEGNSREMLRDEVISLYFAGFETTARTMTFLMYLLGRHGQYHAPLRAEAAAFGRPDGAVAVLAAAAGVRNRQRDAAALSPVAILARPAGDRLRDRWLSGHQAASSSSCRSSASVILAIAGRRQFRPDPQNPLQKRVTIAAPSSVRGGPRICLASTSPWWKWPSPRRFSPTSSAGIARASSPNSTSTGPSTPAAAARRLSLRA
jgi:hypothetical protein